MKLKTKKNKKTIGAAWTLTLSHATTWPVRCDLIGLNIPHPFTGSVLLSFIFLLWWLLLFSMMVGDFNGFFFVWFRIVWDRLGLFGVLTESVEDRGSVGLGILGILLRDLWGFYGRLFRDPFIVLCWGFFGILVGFSVHSNGIFGDSMEDRSEIPFRGILWNPCGIFRRF